MVNPKINPAAMRKLEADLKKKLAFSPSPGDSDETAARKLRDLYKKNGVDIDRANSLKAIKQARNG